MAPRFATATIIILAAMLVTPEAVMAKGISFKASVAQIKQACKGGTFTGTNKDGFYGCLTKGANTTCKKGKCVSDKFRIQPSPGGGSTRDQNDIGGNDGVGRGNGASGVNTGNANLNNAGAQVGGGGGTIN